MPFGNDECVTRRDGLYVQECQDSIVLIDTAGPGPTGNDVAKNTFRNRRRHVSEGFPARNRVSTRSGSAFAVLLLVPDQRVAPRISAER